MRRLLIIFASGLILAAAAAGCGRSAGSDDLSAYAVCADSSAVTQASRIAAGLTPYRAAEVLARWMMQESAVGDAAFVHELYCGLRSRYGQEAPVLDKALDSIYRCSEAPQQARMLVVSASPERVAASLMADSASRRLIRDVERAYEGSPRLLERFRRSLSSD